MRNVVATAAIWIASMPFTVESWLFVPINILFACSVGTACAFAWSDKQIEPLSKKMVLIVTCIAMGAAFTAICNMIVGHLMPDMKITEGAQSGMGAVVSFCTKPFLPWARDFVGQGKWTRLLPWMKKEE